jgi:glycosyltransferase involved in cell wall biosynthesis
MEVSIIMTAYNQERYIERAVRSALDQTYDHEKYEIVVVDDSSTDKTGKILKSFGKAIKMITLKKNTGISYARNKAILESLGRYVVCVDADDYIANDLVYIERLFLKENCRIDAVSCDYLTVDNGERITGRKDASQFPIACGIMFQKDKLIDIGLYDEKFLVMEDLDLRKRCLEKYNIYNIPLPLYRYRGHDRNITKKAKLVKKYLNKVYKKHKIKNIERYLKKSRRVKKVLQKCSL